MINLKVFKLNYFFIFFIIIFILLSCFMFISYSNYESTDSSDFINVPIVMYHSIMKSKKGDYIISLDKFENDLIYIKNSGYTTITINDLINYVYKDFPLPSKPIILSFDDGFYNNLEYGLPLLEKYNMKAVISIIGKYTDEFSKTNEANSNYGHLRWEDIKKMMDTNIFEFQNHTYDLHKISNGRKGCMKKKYESVEEYNIILSNDLNLLQDKFKKHTNYVPLCFTYPYGAISKESIDILKKLGFKSSLSCISGVNKITKNPDCLFNLKRFDRKNM